MAYYDFNCLNDFLVLEANAKVTFCFWVSPKMFLFEPFLKHCQCHWFVPARPVATPAFAFPRICCISMHRRLRPGCTTNILI